MEWNKIVAFIEEVEGLKSVYRTAATKDGRKESTAEHSWRLALFALAAAPLFPELDREKLIALCLVHDLGELYGGDISAVDAPDPQYKLREETAAMSRMCALLPEMQSCAIKGLWQEYEDGSTLEAKFVRALDKAETILQHSQGSNSGDSDYAFNLEYGKHLFDDPRLQELRKILDAKTRKRLAQKPDCGDCQGA